VPFRERSTARHTGRSKTDNNCTACTATLALRFKAFIMQEHFLRYTLAEVLSDLAVLQEMRDTSPLCQIVAAIHATYVTIERARCCVHYA
jgi:hypothetical protein